MTWKNILPYVQRWKMKNGWKMDEKNNRWKDKMDEKIEQKDEKNLFTTKSYVLI